MSNRPSQCQVEALVEFLEENRGIAKELLKTSVGRVETKRKWAALAGSLNSLGGANKNGLGWAKYWSEKKCSVKKQCAQLSSSMRRTGGGPSDKIPMLSAIEQRMVAVMGGPEFATGDSQFAVDPFLEVPIEIPDVQQSQDMLEWELENGEVEVTVENAMDINHTSPISSTAQDVPLPPATSETSNAQLTPQRRNRNSSRRSIDSDLENLAQMEERRINAELITARAFADVAGALRANTAAMEHIAAAITEVARAITGMSNTNTVSSRMPPPHDYI